MGTAQGGDFSTEASRGVKAAVERVLGVEWCLAMGVSLAQWGEAMLRGPGVKSLLSALATGPLAEGAVDAAKALRLASSTS